jgi:hypothetical protein
MTLAMAMISWIWHQKHTQQKPKIDNWGYIRLKDTAEEIIESKGNLQNGRKYDVVYFIPQRVTQ